MKKQPPIVWISWTAFVVFLVLKLAGTIDWSWWWITAPVWAPSAVGLVIFLACALVLGVITVLESK